MVMICSFFKPKKLGKFGTNKNTKNHLPPLKRRRHANSLLISDTLVSLALQNGKIV